MKKRIISLVIAMAILVGILPTVLPPLKVSASTVSSEKHSVDTSKLTMPTVIKFYRSDNGNVEKNITSAKTRPSPSRPKIKTARMDVPLTKTEF